MNQTKDTSPTPEEKIGMLQELKTGLTEGPKSGKFWIAILILGVGFSVGMGWIDTAKFLANLSEFQKQLTTLGGGFSSGAASMYALFKLTNKLK